MHPYFESLTKLVDPSGFVPRAMCGEWTKGEILLNNISDLLVFLAYISIPIMLMIFARRQRNFPYSWLSVVFAAFILTCGATHLMEIVLFYYPIYRLAGWVKAITALASWIAVVALYRVLPFALSLHSPADLERAKDELTASHTALEARLREQNGMLVDTNEQMQQALKELEDANEIRARFLANLSHELRTPMVSIIGLAELALEDESWNVRDSLVKIGRSARSLDALFADLLEFSKLEAGKLELRPKAFQLVTILDNIQSTLSHFAQAKRLELRIEVSETLREQNFLADSSRIQHVLVNLIQNALKFTEQGTVELQIVERSPASAKSALLRFCVEDSGVGIPAEKLSEIFEPFRQVDESLSKREAGSGLGLAICKELLTLMDTDLLVESTSGSGSRFWFDLEVAKCDEPGEVAIGQSSDPPRVGHLLLVEDNPINRAIIGKILTNAGHTVQAASTGTEALKLIATTTFDLALVDLQLPDLDGISIATQMRAEGLDIPLFALTAHGEESYKIRAMQAGMTGFLVKPTPTNELLAVISEALASRSGST